jgi:hypothetical protein
LPSKTEVGSAEEQPTKGYLGQGGKNVSLGLGKTSRFAGVLFLNVRLLMPLIHSFFPAMPEKTYFSLTGTPFLAHRFRRRAFFAGLLFSAEPFLRIHVILPLKYSQSVAFVRIIREGREITG